MGKWVDQNQSTIFGAERCNVARSSYCNFSRKGNTLFIHVYDWPGDTVAIGGLKTRVKSARLLVSGREVKVEQDELRARFTGLPAAAPDSLATVIAAECDSEPAQDMVEIVRKGRKRYKA